MAGLSVVLCRLPGEEEVHCFYQNKKTIHTITNFSETVLSLFPLCVSLKRYISGYPSVFILPEKIHLPRLIFPYPFLKREIFKKQVESDAKSIGEEATEKVIIFQCLYPSLFRGCFDCVLSHVPELPMDLCLLLVTSRNRQLVGRYT